MLKVWKMRRIWLCMNFVKVVLERVIGKSKSECWVGVWNAWHVWNDFGMRGMRHTRRREQPSCPHVSMFPHLANPLPSPWHRSAATADIWISLPQHLLFLQYNTQYLSCICVSIFCISYFERKGFDFRVLMSPCCRCKCKGCPPPRTSPRWRPCRGCTWVATPCPSASTTRTRL